MAGRCPFYLEQSLSIKTCKAVVKKEMADLKSKSMNDRKKTKSIVTFPLAVVDFNHSFVEKKLTFLSFLPLAAIFIFS